METAPILIQSFSLNPSRLSLYNTLVKPLSSGNFVKEKLTPKQRLDALKNIYGEEYTTEKRFHNFELSESARKNMIAKINWLYFLAKPKHIKTYSGKDIYNFKINFITLTLPSKQKHSTSVILKECLNQFITEMRERVKLHNYVWRLEFQKNGNVHFHIVTDVYIDFFLTQKVWNRIINKLGYVDAYQEKHNKMTLFDYAAEYSNHGRVNFDTLKKRYAKGKAINWKEPNSTDVISVSNGKKIAFYISKYFSKKEKSGTKCNELDNIENSMGLRLWFCSRSLSAMKKITDFVPAFKIDLLALVKTAKDLFVVVHDFCTSFYYTFAELENKAKGILHKILKDYSLEMGYSPAT